MINFIKKQFFKILVYLVAIIPVGLLWIYKGWSISLLGTYISLVTSIFAFVMSKTWIEDYKLEVNKELEKNKNELNKELEKYKTKLSSYTLVTKLQYDLEFKIYTELISKISNTLNCLIKLKAEVNEKTNRESYNKIAEIIEITIKYQPFYSKKIYKHLEVFLNEIVRDYQCIAGNNGVEINLKTLISIYGKNNIEVNLDKLYQYYDQLSELIRQRIENMKIIED